MNTILRLLCCSSIALSSSFLQAETLLNETFESADMSTTGSQGFSWEPNNRTSVVFGDGASSTVVWSNGPKNNVKDDLDWNAWEGSHSLRFRWPAGENWSEQRYQLGTPQKELWLSYYIRVPHNYAHCSTCDRRNNKFFSVWMDKYETQGDGSTFWLSMEDAGDGNTDLAFTYTKGNKSGTVGFKQHSPFINASTDRGRWMQIVIQLRTESSAGAGDGIIGTWRRWSDESAFAQLHDLKDVSIRIPASGPQGFNQGYFFGWANGPYAEDTDWLMDEVKIATTSLLEVGPVSAKPMPANNLTIRIDR